MLLPLVGLILSQASFDVASVKPAQIRTDSYSINLGRTSHGELTLGNATLADCLKFAYGLTSDIQLSGPDWISRKGEFIFDIVGKAPAGTPRTELLRMLQTLLTERFQLVLRRELRSASYLSLVPDAKGLKLEEADANLSGATPSTFHPGHIDTRGVYLPMFATLLSRFMGQPVIDQTGLTSRYFVKLDWSPDNDNATANAGPTIYTALREQLGLKLESRKGPLETLVVDAALKTPIAN